MWLFIIIVFHSIISIVYLNSLRSWLILTVPKASIFFSLWLKCVFQRDAKSINIQRFLRLCFLSAYSLAAGIIVRIDGDGDFSSDSGFCLLCFSPVWRLGSWVRLCQSPYSGFWICTWFTWLREIERLWIVSEAKMNVPTKSCYSRQHTVSWEWDKVDRWEWQLRAQNQLKKLTLERQCKTRFASKSNTQKKRNPKDSTQTEWLPRDSMDLHTVISIAWALRQTNLFVVVVIHQ